MSTSNLSEKEKWLLAVIFSSDYVEGKTRLQKYCLLCSREILRPDLFFNDWIPGHYGGFSKDVAATTEMLTKKEYIEKFHRTNEYGIKVMCFKITKKSQEIIKELTNSEMFAKISAITNHYSSLRAKELLADVY